MAIRSPSPPLRRQRRVAVPGNGQESSSTGNEQQQSSSTTENSQQSNNTGNEQQESNNAGNATSTGVPENATSPSGSMENTTSGMESNNTANARQESNSTGNATSTGVPENATSTGVPENATSTGVPENATSTGVPENATSPSGSTASNNTGNMSADLANGILTLMNRERAAVGVPPLVWNDTAAAHAKAWAEYLAAGKAGALGVAHCGAVPGSEQIESCTHHEGEDLVWYAPHDANRSERTGSTFGSPKRRIITGDRRQGSRPGNR